MVMLPGSWLCSKAVSSSLELEGNDPPDGGLGMQGGRYSLLEGINQQLSVWWGKEEEKLNRCAHLERKEEGKLALL